MHLCEGQQERLLLAFLKIVVCLWVPNLTCKSTDQPVILSFHESQSPRDIVAVRMEGQNTKFVLGSSEDQLNLLRLMQGFLKKQTLLLVQLIDEAGLSGVGQ